MIQIKRTYDPPARGDGRRILVERLWPRGMTKERLAADAWLKEVAPSTKLRKWFDHRVERWAEFQRRYRRELSVVKRVVSTVEQRDHSLAGSVQNRLPAIGVIVRPWS